MANISQYSQRSTPLPEREASKDLVSFHTDDTVSLEDLEFRERHGEHYTLRHHLSGCAQTLHTIDFEHDFFSSPAVTAAASTPSQTEAVAPASSPGFTVSEASLAGYSVPQNVSEALQPQSATHLATSDEAPAFLNNDFQIPEFGTITPPAETPSALESASPAGSSDITHDVASADQASADSFIADFNDGSLGGWQLGANVLSERVIQDGQLHFTTENIVSGQTLLSQSLALQPEHQYQFLMSVQMEAGTQPDQFILLVNGKEYPMEVQEDGENFILKVTFVTSHPGMSDLAIMPAGNDEAYSGIWLDNLTVMPVSNGALLTESPHELALLAPEPTLGFTQLAIVQSEPVESDVSNLNLSLMMPKVEPSLFMVIGKEIINANEPAEMIAESMLQTAHESELTPVADISSLPIAVTETPLLDILEIKSDFN